MMSIENWSAPDEMLSCDACLLGMGAISKNQFFHRVFPEFLREKNLHINCLELLTISIAMKIWGKQFGGKKVLVYCDNEASVSVKFRFY